MRHNRLAIAVVFLVGSANAASVDRNVEMLIGKADPAIQAQIQKVFDVLQKADGDAGSNMAVCREVQTLKKLSNDKDELVRQLANFVVTTKSVEDTHVLIAGIILNSLDLKPSVPIRVLALDLEADNPQLRDFAVGWFDSHDKADRDRPGGPSFEPVNYHDYLEYVQWKVNRKEEVPVGFVKYIYERSPGRALLVFAYANSHGDVSARMQAIRDSIEGRLSQEERSNIGQQQLTESQTRVRARRQIELAEHIISNGIWLDKSGYIVRFQKALPEVKEALATLIEGEWWARLYVAWVMRQNPALVQPEMVKRLAEDSHELVKETAKAINLEAVKAAVDAQRARAATATPKR